MATFTNQANITLNGLTTSSNVTTGEVTSGLTVVKTSVSGDYGRDDHVVYVVTVENTGVAITGATITDDLGTYTLGESTVTPLTYVEGSLLFYQNGALATGPVAVGGPPLVISGINIPAGGNVQIIYEAATNAYTPYATGSTITNTATLTVATVGDTPSDTATVTARDEVLLSIAKAMTPTTVNEDGTLTYTLIIQNVGNTAVISSDDLTVNDVFNPILNPITVTLDGAALAETTDYTYDETTGEFATLPGTVKVPAATYSQDAETGVYSVTPGVAVITITGTV